MTIKHAGERPALTDTAPAEAEPEIEVTPAMLAAGEWVLYAYETETAGEVYWAECVYRAMALASLAERSVSIPQDDS
jgi:hypothetical protein